MDRRTFVKNTGMLGLAASLPSAAYGKERPTKRLVNQNIPINDNWDVIVVGGGPAGCAAAIASAREGAKTLLLEAMGVLGGMGTAGLVPAWTPFSDGEKIIYKGIAEKVFRESKKGVPHFPDSALDWVDINPEYLKVVYDRLVKESGAHVLFYSRMAAVNKKSDDTIDSILVANKAGLTAFKSKVYIDCTGDADLSAWAGAHVFIGDNEGNTQLPSFCFSLSNIDPEAFKKSPKLHYTNKNSPIYQILASGDYSLIVDDHICNPMISPGVVQFNAGHLHGIDPLNPESLSEAMFRGREMVVQYHEALKKFLPETYGNSTIANTCSLLSVRESRRIEGDYIFTLDDWLNRRHFDDEIGQNNYYIDIHKGTVMNDARYEHYKKGETHGIPYRILTPKGLVNLLVAGRPISTDPEAFGSLRIQPACLVTGEAAGLAGALAAKQSDHNVHNVDILLLRKRLKEEGQNI